MKKGDARRIIMILVGLIAILLIVISVLIIRIAKQKETVLEKNITLIRGLYDKAIEKKDASLCNRIGVEIMRETCRIEVNVRKKNAGYCDKLGDERVGFIRLFQNKTVEFTLKEECLRWMAVEVTKNCGVLPNELGKICEQDRIKLGK